MVELRHFIQKYTLLYYIIEKLNHTLKLFNQMNFPTNRFCYCKSYTHLKRLLKLIGKPLKNVLK